jgi:AbrB family looped-hinge helix DNA binding protein
MARSRVSSKGQVVIPKAMRDALRWSEGTDVELERKPGGIFMKAASLRLPTPSELARVAGCLKYNGPPKTIEEMDRAVGDAFRRKWKK